MLLSRVHSYLDYPMMLVMILSPWLLGFSNHASATLVPVVIGMIGLVYSVLTDYETSMTRQLPLRSHIGMDMACGAFLALSPWLFGFAYYVFWPHVVLGLIEVGTALVTVRESERDPRMAHHH